MGQELQTILDTRYRGAASAGLCLVPSYCLCHLPRLALDVLAPWLQMFPQQWTTTVVVDDHDQPCVEAQGYTFRPSYIPGALSPSPTGEAAGTLLPPPP